MTSLVRRVVAGLFANAFGQAVHIAIQLLSFPIFLHYWTPEQYGVWLLLSATPAYLAMADIGMVTTAGNRMTMEMGKGDVATANRIFQSAVALTGSVCIGIALLVVPYCLWGPIYGVSTNDERFALAALALTVLVAPLSGLTESIFRATGRYPTSASLATFTRLAEWGASLLGLWAVGSFSAVAIYGLTGRAAGTALAIYWASTRSQGLKWGVAGAKLAEIRSMLIPSLSFMSFPLASALSLQGMTLLVGQFFGPVVVTSFSAFRMLARVTVQTTAMFSFAIWPEFSRLFGMGSLKALLPVYSRSEKIGIALSILLSISLYLLGPWLLRVWTHGKIAFEPELMALMLTYAAVAGLAHVPRTLLMAINRHTTYAQWNVAAGIGVLLVSIAIGNSLGIAGVGLAMLIVEIMLSGICIRLVRQTLAESQPKVVVEAP